MDWITAHWVEIVAALWSFDQLLKIVGKLTPTQIDDNIADWLGNLLTKFFPKGQ